MSSNETTSPEVTPRCGGRHWKKFPLVVLGVAGIILVKGALVMAFWNHLIPELFNGPTLRFGQAVGLMILVKLLVGFGGFRGHHGGRFGWRARWMSMSPEEREKLREEFRRRCH